MAKKRKATIAIVSFGVLIIVFAFVFEAIMNSRDAEEEQAQELRFEDSSEVQAEINQLDWIVPMPLTPNPFSRPGTPLREVTGIVIHNIGNPGTTAEQNRNFFDNLAVSQTSSVSSNFIVDLDGAIVQCIPVDEVAYASNHRNDDTLSIEVCHPDESGEFTAASYASVVRLTAWLCNRYGLTADEVLRHYDVYGKQCPKYFVDNEDAWDALKADVRAEMERLR